MPSVTIPTNQHVFIAGRTGSGKTFLAEQYLNGYKNVCVLDTKGLFTWESAGKEVEIVTKISDLPLAVKSKIIYRPIWQEMKPEYYNAFFEWCYNRRNTIVYVDEFMSVSDNPFKIPDYCKAILTRGREHNVSLWVSTQRPSGISQIAISEASHFFIFTLNLQTDREKVASITGMRELLERPEDAATHKEKYIFWYVNIEKERAILAKLK